MPANIESDPRWRRYGGLAGVFVFCSISITGALWHSRRAPGVRGVDHAALAAAAYERRWALWRSADPASLPPRFGESAATAALRRASFDMSGFTRTGLPLEWEGLPEAWQAKSFTVGVGSSADTRTNAVSWTLGTNAASSVWIRVGSADSNRYAEAFSDDGGVFRANGFEVSPPCLDAVLNRWTGGGAWRTVTVRPLPGFPWPTNGQEAAVAVTNTPSPSEALWPQMHGDFIWGAARSLRSSLLSEGPCWLLSDVSGSPVTGSVHSAGGTTAVRRAYCGWGRSPGGDWAAGEFGDGAGAPDPAAPEGGWWRALTGSTNPAGYSCEGTPLAAVPNTNLLWECLRAASGMARAIAPASYAFGYAPAVPTVHAEWDDGSLVRARTNAWDGAGAWGDYYSYRNRTEADAPPGLNLQWDRGDPPWETVHTRWEADAPSAAARLEIPGGSRAWPCASACASGLVSRVRVYAFPCASPGGLAAALRAGAYIEPEGYYGRGLPPVERPPLLLAEFTPAEWASPTGLSLSVATPAAPALLAAAETAAEEETTNYTGRAEAWDVDGRTNATVATRVSVTVRRGKSRFDAGPLYAVADFAFTNLAGAAGATE